MRRLTTMVVSPAERTHRARDLVAEALRRLWPRPRVRRPVDGARLVVASAVVLALVLLAAVDAAVLRGTTSLFPTVDAGIPRTVLSIVNVIASLGVVALFAAIVVRAVRMRPFRLTGAVLACAVAFVLVTAVVLVARLTGSASVLTILIETPRQSAGLPVTMSLAVLVGADLRRSRWSLPARVAVAVAIGCALALGSLTLPSALFAVLIGVTAALAVRVAVGVVPARPATADVLAVLGRAGWWLTDLRPLEQAAGWIRYTGARVDGHDLLVTVVDPDRRGVPFAARLWRLARFRAPVVGRPALSLRGQLEQQALTAALAAAAGVAAPRMLALVPAGAALVLVEQPLVGTPLPAAEGTTATEGAADAWAALRRLHDAGVSHGTATADRIVVLPGGGAGFADLDTAQPAATELQRELDVVAMLVTTAVQLGAGRAIDALRAGFGTSAETEARIAALMQPLALPPAVRRSVRGTPLLGEVRSALVQPGAEHVASAPRLERLRPRTVLSVVGGTVAAYLLAGQLSQIDLATTLRQAHPVWLGVALLGSAVTYLGAALALIAFVPTALRLGRTVLAQLAASFVALVTPPAVGHVGLNIRYLQRANVPTASATASVAVDQVVTVAATVPVLLICAWLSGVSASRLTLLPSGDVLTVLLVAAGVLTLAVGIRPTRRLLRRRLEPIFRRTLPQLVAAASDPRRLATAVTGVLVLNGGYVVALWASLLAFSHSLALPVLVVVYLAASTLGSAAPTPGGLGAIEAALVGGLTATGIPVAAALPAVLVFRTATFWLPAPVGWGAFVFMQRRGWI